jgi:hypothetical protein
METLCPSRIPKVVKIPDIVLPVHIIKVLTVYIVQQDIFAQAYKTVQQSVQLVHTPTV